MANAVLNFWENGESVASVEIQGAPLPREGEKIAIEDSFYLIRDVVHDYAPEKIVGAPEIILLVEEVDDPFAG